MNGRILVSCGPGEQRIAYTVDDRLEAYALCRPGAPDGVGDLYRGRVVSIVSGLAGAFIALPQSQGEALTGFLPDSVTAAGLSAGDSVVVAVARAPQGGKGARLTAKLNKNQAAQAEASRQDGLLAEGPNALVRMIARFPGAPVIVDDPSVGAWLCGQGIQPVLKPIAFEGWLEDEVEILASSVVETDDGARFSIHPTPALVAVDCDAGRQIAEGGDTSRLHWQANQRLIPELTRQIRLRNLSGAILIDFAGLSPKKRQGLRQTLEEYLALDLLKPRLLGFTALGLAEIVRSRVQAPLHELLNTPLGKGIAVLRRALLEAAPTGALTVSMPSAWADALRSDPDALPFCERKRGYSVELSMRSV